MRNKLVGLVLAGVVMPWSAAAQDSDYRKIRCGEFMAATLDEKKAILMFLAGYIAGQAGVPIMYRDNVVNMGATIGKHCVANKDDHIMKAAGVFSP